MAGIGFELYKILQKGTLGSILKTFFLGSIIVAGPWILSVLSIYFIQKYAYIAISEDPVVFTVTIVYLYAFSLILFGGIQYIFSRYIADMMYIEKDEAIPTALVTVFYLTIILSLLISFVFISFNNLSNLQFPLIYKISFCLLFVTLNLIWLMLIYIALLKEYNKIFVAYLLGVLVSIAGVYIYGQVFGVGGALFGYTLGQVVIVLLLMFIAQKSYPIRSLKINKDFFTYFRNFKYLFLIGTFFNLSIWTDKIMYWFTYGANIDNTLYYYYAVYDIPVFLAFLTMIPALVYFLVVSEPGFHREYTVFIKDILNDTLTVIQKNKDKMLDSMKKGVRDLFLFQAVWTVGLMLNLKTFFSFMGYGTIDINIMYVLLVAVLFHVSALNLQIFLLYLEFRKEALMSTVVYFAFNTLFTILFIYFKIGIPGVSFMLGAMLSSIYSLYHLARKSPVIDYIIFNRR